MESKQEGGLVWSQASEHDQNNHTQIVYSDGQDRQQQQQVVYTADGSSYTSVDTAEHTMVYIHPSDGGQAVFADQSQVAYIQQDGTTQQELLEFPVKGQFEVSEGTPNGLKSQEPHPQEPQPESPAQTEEGQDQEQGQPAAAPQKEEPDPTPTETHLSAEDMRRARRIRVRTRTPAALQGALKGVLA
ncbi:UNVERIFIED_CONTAM: hypothetical protein FKN15_027802 [Acipenser sinensis]